MYAINKSFLNLKTNAALLNASNWDRKNEFPFMTVYEDLRKLGYQLILRFSIDEYLANLLTKLLGIPDR